MPAALTLLLLLAAGSPAGLRAGSARADADGDGVPDGVGQTVTVAGRAITASGHLGGPFAFFVQDGRGGIRIDGPSGPAVARGDSVVATGRLAFRGGVTVLDRPRVRVIPGSSRLPLPAAYPSHDPESVEGGLVTAEGIVAGRSVVPAGTALTLWLDDGATVVTFVFAGRPDAIPLDDFQPGDRLRVTGVAGQYEHIAPYRSGYQIYPRSAADVVRAGIPAAVYRLGALALLCLFTLALLWAAMLRRQVARRVAELAGSENRYRVLVERASDAVVVHDLSGAHAELNATARRVAGLAPTDAVPPLEGFIAPSHRRALLCHIRRLRTTGQARTDLCVRRADGTQGIYEVESQTLSLDGRARVFSLARDVGARRAHESALVEARLQAEETLRVKSAFLANMSHEIRTPLTAVIGFAEILRDEVPDDQRDLVAGIESGGHRLLATLNSVLDLARLDSGRETLRPADLDVVAHVAEGVHLFDALAARKGLALVFAPAAPALHARLDAGALDRVLFNLVGNAVKFTDGGCVAVGLRAVGDRLRLDVTDTGVGMSETFLPTVFDEFRQASEGEARSHEGTGLGMSITRQLVELMGGTIAVESALGIGTTFTVMLPLNAAPEPAAAPAPSATATALA